MEFTEWDVSAMIAESREACKRIQKLGMLRKTVATHRLKELRHLCAVEKLATWRRSNGFDQCDVIHGQWIHGPLSPRQENHRKHVDRSVRVKEGNLDVRKREIEAEGREFH